MAGFFDKIQGSLEPRAKNLLVAGKDEAPCARKILSSLMRQAYRRPVTDVDLEDAMGLYQAGRNAGDFDSGIRLALQGILASPLFVQLWARHDVAVREGIRMTFEHPQVGPLTLNREKLLVGGTDGIMLVLYHPDAGSGDAEKLALLGSSVAPALAEQAARH